MRFNHKSVPFLNSTKFQEELVTMLQDVMGNLAAIFDSGVSFFDNIDGAPVSFISSATPDAENAVTHHLGRIPVGFMMMYLDKPSIVYAGPTAWTATTIYLRANIATVVVRMIVF